MPIRFRCAYCNQLMGIARRKAGTVVKCPKCAGEIIVPTPEGGECGAEGVELAGDNGQQPPFEPPPPNETAVAVTETAAPAPALPPPPPPARLGVFLSIGTLAISVVVIILLLILMLVLGLIIGKSMSAPAEQKTSLLKDLIMDS